MFSLKRFAGLTLAALLAAGAAHAAPRPRAMVAAANPLAVDAGVNVLRAGGSVVDAAVAIQMVLGLVEPQSSGLGGGAFMTYYDAKTHTVTAYNGRETAPAGATPDMFMADGKTMSFATAVTSGRSAGVPGAIAMLYLAHQDHGKLPWSSLFADAERLATDGFVVSPRLEMSIRFAQAPQPLLPDPVAYFTKPDGTKYKSGDVLRNQAYADTLKLVAAQGPKALLEGPIAQAIIDKLHQGPIPGTMTLADLAAYRPKSSPALCKPYHAYVVCVPPAPSGGPALLEGLGILAHTDIGKHPNDVQGWYIFSQASRLMYVDRDRYQGDPDFVDVPTEGLLDPAYTARRAALIDPRTAGPPPGPGAPRGAGVRAPDHTMEPGGTTHMVIVDKDGNALSMTTTVESIFGDGRMVGGFFLNNQLTDFSFNPKEPDGVPAANAVAPGKRPRSSMSPAIVLDRRGRFVAAVGSPGGTAILAYDLKALTAVLDWKMPIQDAINLPNLISRGTSYNGEIEKFPPGVVAGLAARGVTVTGGGAAEGSGLHGVEMTPAGLRGGADPRREGVARVP
jgi:gamma-glutamyltranspeptidase/glutathione hydrolase